MPASGIVPGPQLPSSPLPLKPVHWHPALPSLSTGVGEQLPICGLSIEVHRFPLYLPTQMCDGDKTDGWHQVMGYLQTNTKRPWGVFIHSLMDPITGSPLTCRHPASFPAPSSITLPPLKPIYWEASLPSLITGMGEWLGLWQAVY